MCLEMDFSLNWNETDVFNILSSVLRSKHYENIQICEDDDVSIVTVTMWNNIFRANGYNIKPPGP